MATDADDVPAQPSGKPAEPPAERRRRFGRRRERKPRKAHFSEILRDLAADESRTHVSVGELLRAMGDRAFGALMLVFALPNVIPTPPGTSAILGAPLVFLAAQMTFGRRPWLPKVVARRSVARAEFAALVERIGPWLARAERLMRPRLSGLTVPPVENLIGLVCLLLSIILALPIPLGNMLPAFAICLFAFAILERDGVWVVLGTIMSVISITIVGGVVYALIKAVVFVVANAVN